MAEVNDSKSLTGLDEDAAPAGTDLLLTVDVSDTSASTGGTNKRVQVANLPIGTAAAAALAAKAPLASPALTGTPTAPTASPGTNTTQLATTAFVHAAVIAGGGGGGGVTLPIAESDVTGLVADLSTLTTAVGARLAAASNLSDLASAATARTNLGLGTAATTAASAYATAAQGAKADTALQASFAGSTSVVTVGTVTAGTWHGSPIAVAYLGSGTPASGKYLDGAGSWTTLPAGSGLPGAISATSATGVSTITTTDGRLVLEQTGGSYGQSKLSLLNELGLNGAMFEAVGLFDLIFKSDGVARNIRYKPIGGLDGSAQFEFGNPYSPGLFVSDATTKISTASLGFYGATPVPQAAAPTTLADVIAILRALGLCS